MSVSSHRKGHRMLNLELQKSVYFMIGRWNIPQLSLCGDDLTDSIINSRPWKFEVTRFVWTFFKKQKKNNTQRFHVICCVYCANTLISCFAENKNHYCFCGSQIRPCTLGSKILWKKTHFSLHCTFENLHNFVRNS